MGGHAFRSRPTPISVARLSPALYVELRNRCILILQTRFDQVCTPVEAPEKEDHGDIDIIVGKRLYDFTAKDLSHALGAKDYIQNGHTSSFAIPLPDVADGHFQLDVQTCKHGFFEWETTIYAYGDLWRLLGMSAVRLGFTINDNGLHVRVAEIEATHPRDCLLRLTYEPREMMNYLRLDIDRFKAGFRNLDEVFTWATSSRFFRRECFEKRMGKPQQSKKAEWPMYVKFITEWLPQHPDVGVVEEDPLSQRLRLTEEALDTFDKRCEYRRMVEDSNQSLMKDTMWQKIVKALPLEGKELGEAIKALKALLRWEDGVPVLCVEGRQGKRIPALEEEIVDSLILPWVVEHWQEAVTQNKR